eukprot:TRINITY_DN31656_c0_g1_i3.p1 TRINITY_DN31656_c0_g1~~TRINITY_DN31656_c0_g1_i3.p1  ORF type:complete len:312 (+),score=114.29 TRINITY_DN31656_c0_g1_i3:226-1161(+)
MTDVLLSVTSPQQGVVAHLLGGRAMPRPETEAVVDTGDQDFVCGDLMVTADGKLKKKGRGRRRRVQEVEQQEEETEGTHAADELTDSVMPSSMMGIESRGERTLRTCKWDEQHDTTGGIAADPVKTGLTKDFASSLIIMPPISLWEPIQALRREHDPAYERWMPHINMVWPFSRHQQPVCAMALREQLKRFPPFDVYFLDFDVFDKGSKKSGVLYLKPTTKDGKPVPQLAELRKLALQSFPDLTPDDDDEPFTPHLTVGKMSQCSIRKVREAAQWQPIKFRVAEVFIILRIDSITPFTVQQAIPLGFDLED